MSHRNRIGITLLTALFLRVSPAQAVDEADIKRAVAAGVNYLRATQGPTGRWDHTNIGATSLASLALLECGVRADDPSLLAAARTAGSTSNQ